MEITVTLETPVKTEEDLAFDAWWVKNYGPIPGQDLDIEALCEERYLLKDRLEDIKDTLQEYLQRAERYNNFRAAYKAFKT